MIALKVVLICALILLVISPALGQQTSTLGLTPGSPAYASGHEGPYLDSAAQMDLADESGAITSPTNLGLAPGSEASDSCQLGMAVGCEQMELASFETALLEKLGYPPFGVPKSELAELKSELAKLIPENATKAPEETTDAEMGMAVGFKTKGEQRELASYETALLEKLGYPPFGVSKSELAELKSELTKLIPENATRAPEETTEA